MRANEKFSGRGHAQHLCKDCVRLGKEELAYRQAIRNLERLVTWEGIIPRKKREQFRKYLEHKDERVRVYARQIEAAGALERAEQRLHREVDDLAVTRIPSAPWPVRWWAPCTGLLGFLPAGTTPSRTAFMGAMRLWPWQDGWPGWRPGKG